MPRTFIETVVNQTVNVNYTYSSPVFNDLLGSPDELAVQVIVDNVSGSLIVYAEFQHSYLGTDDSFSAVTGTAANSGTISAPDKFWLGTPTQTRGPLGRVKVYTSTGTSGVRAIVCGRTKEIP
ncbi:MAG: hypothetical protein HY909_18605 [Deltaproteobacteria bacterium]|nr:hypothetical protein [Deltaproteobacteria bacterium]